MLEIRNVSLNYGSGRDATVALSHVSLDIGPGEFVVALGASGCGKTTLLSCIAGFLEPTEGEILLDGAPVTGPGADRGVVFQKHALMPWLNVEENVSFGPQDAWFDRRRTSLQRARNAGSSRPRRLRDEEDLRTFRRHAAARRHRPGARYGSPRAAHGRAARRLDSLTRGQMQELILNVWRRTGKMAFLITHDVEEAVFLATKLVVMSPRPGRIVDMIDLPFSRRFVAGEDPRVLRADPDFISVRERVLDHVHCRQPLAELKEAS